MLPPEGDGRGRVGSVPARSLSTAVIRPRQAPGRNPTQKRLWSVRSNTTGPVFPRSGARSAVPAGLVRRVGP